MVRERQGLALVRSAADNGRPFSLALRQIFSQRINECKSLMGNDLDLILGIVFPKVLGF